MLVRREVVDDALDGLLRVHGVERGIDEVARLGRVDGGLHGLHVAHLADHDHVGRLAHRVLDRRDEVLRVVADLALRDDRALVLEDELDRVLDRDDVLVEVLVYVVDHGRERRALARARDARHEDEAAVQARELDHLVLGEAELLERDDRARDRSHDEEQVAALGRDVAAEAAHAGEVVGAVDLVVEVVGRDLYVPRLGDQVEDRLRRVLVDGLGLEEADAAVDAHRGRAADLDEEIRGPRLHHPAEHLVKVQVQSLPWKARLRGPCHPASTVNLASCRSTRHSPR